MFYPKRLFETMKMNEIAERLEHKEDYSSKFSKKEVKKLRTKIRMSTWQLVINFIVFYSYITVCRNKHFVVFIYLGFGPYSVVVLELTPEFVHKNHSCGIWCHGLIRGWLNPKQMPFLLAVQSSWSRKNYLFVLNQMYGSYFSIVWSDIVEQHMHVGLESLLFGVWLEISFPA